MGNETPTGSARTPYNWRLLAVLVAAILVSTILVTPYSLAIQGESLRFSPEMLISWTLHTVEFGIIAAIGLAIAGRIGLGLPFLESWLAGRPDWLRVRQFALPAILTGVLVGIALIILNGLVHFQVFRYRTLYLAQVGWVIFLAASPAFVSASRRTLFALLVSAVLALWNIHIIGEDLTYMILDRMQVIQSPDFRESILASSNRIDSGVVDRIIEKYRH